jgi:DNA topoisomerase-1
MSEAITAYCFKCRTKRPLENPRAEYTKSGQPTTRGTCPECGTSLYRMGRTPAHDDVPPPEKVEKPRRSRSKPKPKSKSRSSAKAKNASSNHNTPQRRGKLVIVESPAKARTIENYLGKGYKVKASVGHVRDLLRSKLSVDVDDDFRPHYRVPNDKRDLVKELKAAAAKAREVYLATDADREGEAIAWHLTEVADIGEEQVRRVVFYEITKDAIQEAFAHPRGIDMDKVNAQQARRILDRLVGYELSPLLWDKVRPRLSAGRVQSVAVRLVVEREREIESFVPEEYWTIDAELARTDERDRPDRVSFLARLFRINGEKVDLPTQGEVGPILDELERSVYLVDDVQYGERKRNAAPPFTTSTLQQEASRRLGLTARRTMRLAQQLYEGVDIGNGGAVGLITYMRTDSTHIAEQAQSEARRFIAKQYGTEFVPRRPNVYGKKAKGAQEAHEAIRPTSISRTPDSLKRCLNRDQLRLYRLIWERFLASQMAPAIYDTIRVDVLAGLPGTARAQMPYLFRATGSTLRFAGFLAVYVDVKDEDNGEEDDLDRQFPELEEGLLLDLLALLPEQHFTQPPPRYTEASLVRALEEFGIGRPSTYASILNTIQQRGYVHREEKRLHPTEVGFVVNDLLVENFDQIVDVGFTAEMEDALDRVSTGEQDWVPMLHEFYQDFKADVEQAFEHVPNVELGNEEIGRACPKCGSPLVIRWGRYGKFIGCSTFPTCRHTEPWLDYIGVPCPECGSELVERKTRKGRTFYGCSTYPTCEWTSWKRPLATPCPVCGGLLIVQNKEWAQCTACEEQVPLDSMPETAAEGQADTA